jgi:two-component system, LuxR family, response regulator FixJ
MLSEEITGIRPMRSTSQSSSSTTATAFGPQPTVFIVDADAGLRQSMMLLLGMRGYRTQGLASGDELLAAVRPDSRGCVIIDTKLDSADGMQVMARLRDKEIKLPVLFVSSQADVQSARAALKGGAFDYLPKPIDSERLTEVIAAAVADDRRRWEGALQAARLRQRLARLTQRERQVMQHVVAGLHNREIAVELGISPRTVEVYKARMMDKLDVQRVADLVRLAVRTEAAV